MLKAAEACHKAGVPFGVGLGQTSDSVDTAGAFFQSFGAELVNAKGDLTVKSDAVKQALTSGRVRTKPFCRLPFDGAGRERGAFRWEQNGAGVG